jgi:hypothetical protein
MYDKKKNERESTTGNDNLRKKMERNSLRERGTEREKR